MAAYGDWPGAEWCELIDSIATLDDMRNLLSDVRAQHLDWPPTVAQFAALLEKHRAPPMNWQDIMLKLSERAMKRNPTFMQRQRWTYFSDARQRVAGLRVPADGDVPGYEIRTGEVL
jgi:hypothetical protein